MDAMSPLVTVAVPTYQRSAKLQRALGSVLGRRHGRSERVVVAGRVGGS